MDWNDTDPQLLRANPPPGEPGQTDTPAPIALASDFAQSGDAARPAKIPLQAQSEAQAAPFAGFPPALMAAAAPPPPAVPFAPEGLDAAGADIWQRLSLLVRTPARMDGLWPLLAPFAALCLLVSVATGEWWMTLAWSITLFAGVKINMAHTSRENARDALNMAPLDLRWVGPLAQALHSPHPRVRGVAQQLLIHLLPHLRAGDAGLLNTQQRDYLNQKLALNRRRDHALNKAILAAWVNVGDAASVSYVERLTVAWAWSAGQQQVRETARQALPLLEQRLQAEHDARMQTAQMTQNVGFGVPFAPPPLSANSQAAIADVDAQLDKLREERRKHSKPGMRLAFLLASWVFIVPYTAVMAYTYLFTVHGGWKLGLMWAFLCLLATQLHRFSLSNKQTEAARKLAQTDDIRAVGPLAEALEWPDASIKFTAATGLIRLLPRLTASDGNLLNAAQRANLYGMLRMRYVHSHYPLVEAILKALQQVGDEAAIPVVERLEKAHAYTTNQKRIKQLASDTLPLLATSARNQGASAMLLRASSAQDTPSDLLLRGAMANNEDAPQQLLRASSTQNDAPQTLIINQ